MLDGFTPANNLTEAGATIFYGDFAHNDIGIVGAVDGSGDRFIVTRTIVVAEQVGPWALTTTNSTITTVGSSEAQKICVADSNLRSSILRFLQSPIR